MPLENAAHFEAPSRPEEKAIQNEQKRHINGALDSLQPDHKQVVVMKYYADLTVPEIAKAVGCKEGTVKSRLHRALEQLGRTLSDAEE